MAQLETAAEPKEAVQFTPVRRQSVWQRFRRNRLALLGLVIFVLLLLVAIGAPLVTSYDPDKFSYDLLDPPSREHLLGTDDVGRDVLSRLIYAARVSLTVGIAVSIVAVTLGPLWALSPATMAAVPIPGSAAGSMSCCPSP